jgi:hypothetical protein
LPTNVWVVTSWEEFVEIADNAAYEKAKCYYRNGQMRIETMSVVPTHSRDNAILFFTEILAFAIIADNGSRRIVQSEVLPGLTIARRSFAAESHSRPSTSRKLAVDSISTIIRFLSSFAPFAPKRFVKKVLFIKASFCQPPLYSCLTISNKNIF